MAEQYQVLARKWRPQQFEEVIGQDHVTTTLSNAIEQERLAHAYLFVGPRGVGKTTLARILAKCLNCEKGPTTKPCGKCSNCEEIKDGRSLDVLEIDGASNRGIEEIRQLRDNVRYSPARGRFKIYIIDEVHMLTKEAFNALLKTLEEPPEHVKFFFATTEPQKVLPTILSRCQRFDLRRIPANLIVNHLKQIASDEKVNIDDKALAAIARGAEGGLRDAESALDQLISFCGAKIAEQDVLSVFGIVAHDQLAGLTDALIDGDTNRALDILQQLDAVGKDLQRLLADLLDHFRNLLIFTLGEEAGKALDVADAERELLQAQAQRTDTDAVLRVIDALAAAEPRLRYALSKRIFMEIALVKAIRAREATGIDAVLKKLNELRGQPASRGSDMPPATRAETPAPAASVDEAWQYAVEHLGKVAPLARSYLVGARPIGLKGGVLTVGFDSEFADRRDFINAPRNRELLQAKLREKLRTDVSVRFEIAEATARAPKAAEKPRDRADEFTSDPLIKKALEVFKASIVDVRK
jgi:DNA polymerase-3 subunit gamma/tau